MFYHAVNDLNCITNIDAKSMQPNAVDIRVSEISTVEDVDHVYSTFHDQLFVISDTETVHKISSTPIQPDSEGFVTLYKGIYQFTTPHYCIIPDGYCGWIIHRSSLNRNGVFIMSGLYDSGFQGYVGATLYNLAGRVKIKLGTRVGQFLVAKSSSVGLYTGQYNQPK